MYSIYRKFSGYVYRREGNRTIYIEWLQLERGINAKERILAAKNYCKSNKANWLYMRREGYGN